MGIIIVMTAILYITFRRDIQIYQWSKKSDAEKYSDYRKFINEWNGTNY